MVYEAPAKGQGRDLVDVRGEGWMASATTIGDLGGAYLQTFQGFHTIYFRESVADSCPDLPMTPIL